jgi:hypothetical protein
MENKLLVFGAGVFILILIAGIFISSGAINLTNNVVKKIDSIAGPPSREIQKTDSLDTQDLSKYRSEDIPEDCRLPNYENNVNKWTEHLGHHEDTKYCLDYYK